MRASFLVAGTALALTSALALAQGAPESLLPPGFNEPTAAPAPTPSPRATSARQGAPARPAAAATSAPVIQALPGEPGFSLPLATSTSTVEAEGTLKRLPSLEELARMTPEDFQNLLGLKPDFDMPAGARRAMSQVGLIDPQEGGLDGSALAGQNGRLIRLALAANRGALVSRWGHILLRRALATRLDAPRGMSPQDFLALRVGLLLRMGEPEAARAILQDIDAGNYTPDLGGVALDTYAANGDFTGVCPVLAVQGDARDDAAWNVARQICSAFRGNGAAAIAQLDRYRYRGTMPRIDLLLAQKYAGAAGRSRRAVTIEWDDVDEMTPWRYGLANAVGLNPPDRLIEGNPQLASLTAVTPMVGLTRRAAAADRAAALGVLSSAAMVDLYGQLFAEPDVTGEWSDRAEKLRDAYVLEDPAGRLSAIRSLWDGVKTAPQDYSRKVLTAYAAARLPVNEGMAESAAPLIASMLSAGLDANAMRWANVVNAGSEGWALLVLAAPTRSSEVSSSDIDTFVDADASEDQRKSAFLVAGLAGLGRIDTGTAGSYSANMKLGLGSSTRFTQVIDGAARNRDVASVAMLAGLGMQGTRWSQMSPRYLYHIVSALRTVGLEAEARMIAAEAVARA
ncbi:hypothetical protein HNO88_003136 [Novosphingobium chloroacetimidivorans]|uniref:Lytic transglycosylase domain-containing protein n=1 Tax=Novosphingobium chloroacetimidivorans TaxID=1428314 RepID=A0A7W7NXT9_9SPHN|nr:hypothetical protein [Novosphingobium chloroacetimidivorans]MBB4859804.1 hypothetical protein [Novosphingobium chloroacetimidivorans]